MQNFRISDRCGEIIIPYSEFDDLVGFGGRNVTEIKTLTIHDVLRKHEAVDIVKLVCPRLEEGIFANLPDVELAKVLVWIIGTYDKILETKLNDKFCRAGFKLKGITQGKGTLGWHAVVFKRK